MPCGRAVDDDNTAQNARANNVNLVSHPGSEWTGGYKVRGFGRIRTGESHRRCHRVALLRRRCIESDLKTCDTSAILMLALATCKSSRVEASGEPRSPLEVLTWQTMLFGLSVTIHSSLRGCDHRRGRQPAADD